MDLPLAGIHVLDVGTLTPGKFCTAILADMGASVLRIERPGQSGPISDEDLALNRGKRSATLDLRSPAGSQILCRMAERSDVLVESYRPGVARRLGIDYDTLRHRNPRLVYCSLSGFGQNGPMAGQPGYDLMFDAASGLLGAFVGTAAPPFVPGAYLSDAVSGLMAVAAVCAAIVPQRERGTGCHIDLAMLDSVFSLLAVSHGIARSGKGKDENEAGQDPAASPFYNVYQTADGRYLTLASIRPASCRALCAELGRPELGEREPANENERAGLFKFLTGTFKTATAAEWVARLAPLDIEIASVDTPGEAFENPQLVARGMVVDTSHPEAGDFRRIGNPIRFSTERPADERIVPAPTIGQHTDEVLRELGYTNDAIAQMHHQGAV